MAEFLRGGLVDGRGGQEEDDRFRRNIWVQIFFPHRISHVRDAVISHVRMGGGVNSDTKFPCSDFPFIMVK